MPTLVGTSFFNTSHGKNGIVKLPILGARGKAMGMVCVFSATDVTPLFFLPLMQLEFYVESGTPESVLSQEKHVVFEYERNTVSKTSALSLWWW